MPIAVRTAVAGQVERRQRAPPGDGWRDEVAHQVLGVRGAAAIAEGEDLAPHKKRGRKKSGRGGEISGVALPEGGAQRHDVDSLAEGGGTDVRQHRGRVRGLGAEERIEQGLGAVAHGTKIPRLKEPRLLEEDMDGSQST